MLAHGFARVRCDRCKDELLVAFSCKGRGVCPSCNAKRAHVTAVHLVEGVLPHVPYRQWTLSFPHRVRWVLLKDVGLLSDVLTVFLRAVFTLQRRRARRQGLRGGQAGAVSFIPFFGSALQVTPHFHSLVPDGIFVPQEGGVRFEHANTHLHANDRQVLERLCRYGARGALALERLSRASGRSHRLSDEAPVAERHHAPLLHRTGTFTTCGVSGAPTQAEPHPLPWRLCSGREAAAISAPPRGSGEGERGAPGSCEAGNEQGADSASGLGRAATKDLRIGCVRLRQVWRQA